MVSTQETEQTLSRREREKLAHRKEIMDAATRIFARKGFFNTTLDEIAQEAEFSKGALYLYFSSKEDLLYNILVDKLDFFEEQVRKIFSGKESFRQELKNHFTALAETIYRERDFISLTISQKAACFVSLSEDNAKNCMAKHTEFDQIFKARIQKAIDDNELRDIDPQSVFGMIHGASENMMFSNWGFETLEELKDSVDAFLDILFNGIARKKEG